MKAQQQWLMITGGDKAKEYPDQQVTDHERVGDRTIIYPYGVYCNLPNEVILKSLCESSAVPMTIKRPDDLARGEVAFFHPVTNSRVVMRNNGDVDIYGANVNTFCNNANVSASEDINMTAENIALRANNSITLEAPNANGNGDFAFNGALTSNGKNISDSHTHGGVDTGGGSTTGVN